ncbi:thioredoxin family protein [Maridesulfovibrio salexigens]|uniref:Thioredoxin domain protein n=1 Tax=Maridesulfovibrio salexigens (strain ATCC 14822 / DSM 2638 / NCIMB 8403 / VKM B-1763) TaxID=526222 RepID=C6BW59_MARSD|nr:thioredoxin family protein [Maridesulfovibrio salexigens]ACS80262.1 Thioredoxin domain protein [Maridesulfovibrio salexigens DSM 2638]
MPKRIFVLIGCLLVLGMCLGACSADAEDRETAGIAASDLISGKPHELPITGMVTMVDIGAHACVPCKMMTPVIEELSKEYDGRAAIAFIDVWEYREEAAKYNIRSIPTQIFYDADGKEQYRHVGFLDKKSIVAKLKELGVR